MVNLQVNENPSPALLTAYVVITTLLVVIASFVILTTLWIMPLLYTAEQINSEIEHLLEGASAQKLDTFDLQRFSTAVNSNDSRRHSRTTTYGLKTFRGHRLTILMIEASWILTGIVSTLLFTVDVIVVHWIKYKRFTVTGPLIGTIILVFSLVMLVLVGIFFRFYVVDKFNRVTQSSSEVVTQAESVRDPSAVVWWPHHNVPTIPARGYSDPIVQVV